ncbi:hypothetical protein B8V60_06955 [Streptococcus agalactiae]|uniref:hypothetical protein n=1 Tax=Streptococcus agalactiae TaxID=1311 RepID=UPI0013752622|nr:hypothetical protein [Streptococcus agalactiae]KAF1242507.1 hypothetical protein B8V60_06955 [Streptococcus agalactiae]
MRRVNANWVDFYFLSYFSGLIWVIIFYFLYQFANPIIIATYHESYEIFFYSFFVLIFSIHIYILSNRKKWLQNRKLYKFIKKNKLYSSKISENGSEVVVDSLEMEWIENDQRVIIRLYKSGGPLDNLIDTSLGKKLQAFLKIELIGENTGLDYLDYLFAVETDERLIL